MHERTALDSFEWDHGDRLSTGRPPSVINDRKDLRFLRALGIIPLGNAARSAPADRSRSFTSETHVGLQRVVVKTLSEPPRMGRNFRSTGDGHGQEGSNVPLHARFSRSAGDGPVSRRLCFLTTWKREVVSEGEVE